MSEAQLLNGVVADCISSETPHTWGMLTIERWRRPFSSFTAMRQVHRLPGLAGHAPGNSASFQPRLCLPRLTKHSEEFPLMLQMRVFRTCTPQLCGALPYSWVRFTTQICTSQQDGNVEWLVVSAASPDLLNSSIAGCSLAQALYATGRRDVTMVLLLASGVKICRSCRFEVQKRTDRSTADRGLGYHGIPILVQSHAPGREPFLHDRSKLACGMQLAERVTPRKAIGGLECVLSVFLTGQHSCATESAQRC